MALDTVIGTSTYVYNTDYDPAGRVELRNLGTDVLRTDYVYYAWNTQGGRLQHLKTGKPSDLTSMQYFTYTYDEIGNVKTILDTKNSSQKQCFIYDMLDRITRGTTQLSDAFCQATHTGNGQYDESYAYDGTTGNLGSKGGQALSYGDTNHKHAATAWNGWTYTYDANGNMATRAYGGTTYTLSYDAENHLTSMTGGGVNASFVYDGDGNRVKGIVGGTTTTYIGDYFEWVSSTSNMKKYYYASGVRVAMRTGTSNPLWLLGDHLGSTSKVVNYTGLTEQSQQLYKPWGEKRYPTGAPTLPTTFRYTGQRSETGLGPSGGEGLYFYNARWYDSYLNRWIQPDSIIPDVYNSQSFDRFAYTLNNPVRYTDPSGHCIWDLCILEGIGLIELALVVGGTATAAYLTHPDAREAVTSGIVEIIDLASQGMNSAVEKLRSLTKASGPKPLTSDEKKHVDKLTKGIDDFITEHNDLPEEAEQVAKGEALPEGADHVQEAKDFARGLERSIEHLQSVRDRRTSEAQKVIDQAIEHTQSQLEYLRKLLGDW